MPRKWVFRPRENVDAQARLFCFPSAGSGASMYRDWVDVLPDRVEICGVRYPGRETLMREAPIDDLRKLVAELARSLAPFFDRPFAFFGHSMGAWVAFELARLKRRAGGREPLAFFASARRAPQLPERHSILHPLDDGALVSEVQKRFGGVPEAVFAEPELLELMVPILRADLTALERYEYRADMPLGCPVFAFGGDADTQVTRDELEAWCEQTSGAFGMRIFSGSHFYINEGLGPDLRSRIAEEIARRLGGS